ncbi:MAG: ribosome biogenesis GTP-binding protein YsxC [Acidobacteria bacterium]|nr:MAG: ribosome biogenesis GTP-binding protein YsxC [Acidobacteriota bacterium]
MRVLARFMMSASDARQFPVPDLPEVAFVGRSNVGKSSLINSLLGSKIAKTSSTPGRTRSVNFFEIRWPGKPRPELIFTDLPGYGYAKVSREVSQEWPKFIEPYLQDRPSLALCLALVDGNIPPQENDRRLLEFLTAAGRRFLIVATKTDRLSGNQLRNSLQRLGEGFQQAQVLAYSAKSGAGRDELWQQIRSAAENAAQESERTSQNRTA